MLREVANKLYELFVVNRNATAIQLKDGTYITKYTKITENDIYCMLKEKKSLGSYQQLYKSSYVKWICFDFDCRDKENPNLPELYKKCTLPLNNFLKANNISFVNEFSGRRGIHTWIIFDDYVKKRDAFKILTRIKNAVVFDYDTSVYALDEFPATSNSKGNILGKQVKVPLSFHSCGKQSFLFLGEYKENNYCYEFYKEQLLILNTIKKNKLSDVIRILQLEDVRIAVSYKKMYISESLECSAEQVINILSQTEVYRQLFERLLHGQALLKDWFVMLGTLGKIEGSSDLLCDVFKYCPDFSEKETKRRISQFGYKYFPATFSYLYNLYDLDIEERIDPNENGLQYLIRHLDQNVDIHNWDENEKTFLESSEYTLKKELSYLFTNDEVPVVSIYLDLLHMTSYDSKKINVTTSKVLQGGILEIEPRNYHVFERIESESKIRKMVSLSAYDRVLTSHLALNLFYGMSRKIKSYSYNPNYLSENDMFFHWYNSWGNYLGQIRKFLDFDMYENMQVITLDISHFYDSIDFLGIYRLFDNCLNTQEKNILKELVSYNEKIMRKINGSRKGVPQGPAYARLIAETFLGILVEKVIQKLGNHEEKLFIYRYVDDIVIFHDETLISQNIFNIFNEIFSTYGLTLNQEKSKIYGKIKNLSEEQRCELLRTNQFQYGLRISDYSYLVEDKYIQKKVSAIIAQKGKFDISNIAFFFSVHTDERAKKQFFNMYSKDIFSCQYGRGSGYSLFYKYILSNADVLEKSIEKSLFELIPINSINFSCCLTAIYYAYKNNILSKNSFNMLLRTYIHKIKENIEKVEMEEDKSIILSLVCQEEKMKEIIETFLKRIDLKPGLELACDIFKFIEQCDAKRIIDLEERMAALFCRSVACLPQNDITEDVKDLLMNAFENIRTMANEANGTSELRTLFLLNQVYKSNSRAEYDEVIEEDFELLLDNLEKIRILFRIVDDNANEYFPISSLLFNLIKSDNLLRDISKVKTIQALMLALQIFDKNKYPKQFKDIENIVHEKKLKFVDYLFAGACRLGGDDWKDNYEKNGTLILYDKINELILIRNMNREYFHIDKSIQDIYNFSEVYEEKNEENIGVAYYVEYQLRKFKTVDLKKEFSIPNNRKSILEILKIIYEDKCYNILFENALFRDSKSVRVINPFSKNDTYTIVNNNSVIDGFVGVTEWLKKYGLVTLAGKGIEIVNLGTLISLEIICNVNFDLLGIGDENITFAELLMNWIRNCEDKRNSFNTFLKEYTEKLKYIYDIQDLFGKKFKNDYFMPYSIKEELINELDFDEIINTLPIDTFHIKKDFLNENVIISRSENEEDFSDCEIKDIMGDTIDDLAEEIVACIDEKNHILYTGMDVKYYTLLKEKITQLNSKTLCKEVIDKVDDFNVLQFEKMMLCFQTAYNKVHPDILMSDIVRYRLAHHLLLLQLKKDEVIPWINLLNQHEIVKYSFVNSLPHSGELGVLYVSKDRSRSQSTFKYIYEKYIANPLKRDIVDIYDQKITLEKDGYYVGHEKITKVVFLFDLIQSGRATIDTLEYYLNKDSVEDNIHMVFYCDNKKVSIYEILEMNSNCEVEIYTIYSGEGGRKKVQDYIDEKLENRKCTVLEPLRELSHVLLEDNNKLRKSIYRGRLRGQIYPGDYMVIREYNQPKHNVMSDEIMELEKVVALFCKRAENY